MKGHLDILQQQLETHKKSLERVDDSIKRLNGMEKAKKQVSSHGLGLDEYLDDDDDFKAKVSLSSKVMRINSSAQEEEPAAESTTTKRKLSENEDSLRGLGGRVRRRGGEDEDDRLSGKRPAIHASILSNTIKTKDDLIKMQNKFQGSEQRNKRIFGVILGTLKQFKTEDKERSSTVQAQNRKELEQKVEEKKAEELKKILEERKRLEKEKSRQTRSIQILEEKIRITENFELWKKNQMSLMKSIRTKAKPYVFYMPKVSDEKIEKLIEESASLLEDELKTKQKMLDSEIEALNAESVSLQNEIEEDKKNSAFLLNQQESMQVEDKENEKKSDTIEDLEEEKNEVILSDEVQDEILVETEENKSDAKSE